MYALEVSVSARARSAVSLVDVMLCKVPKSWWHTRLAMDSTLSSIFSVVAPAQLHTLVQ